MRGRTTSARSGFTLIEVVLAMMILLIGMSSLLGLLSFGAALSRTAALESDAAAAVDAVVADLEETLFPLVLVDGREVAGEPREIRDRPVPGNPDLVYAATAVPNPEDPNTPPLEYRVDVEISWASSGAARSRRFSTLLLRQVPFGARLRQRFVEHVEPKTVVPGDPDESPR